MKKLISLFAVLLLAGAANAAITIPNQELVDDSYFSSNTLGIPDSSVGAPEYWRYLARTPAETSDAQIYTTTNTSVAGISDSFSAPIDIFSHPSVTNLPYYDINKTALKSITPYFDPVRDIQSNTADKLMQINAPSAAQVYNGWYVITLDTDDGIYTATSDVENMLTPTATSLLQMKTILCDAWNNMTWSPSDPFAGGPIAYTNINDISVVFSYTNEVPNTTAPFSWFNLRHAALAYEISIDAVDTVLPDSPAGLTANGIPQRVQLNWDDNTEADVVSYNVKRSETSGTDYVTITNLGRSAYSDTNVVNGTTYYYMVSALDYAGNESTNNTEVSATPTDNPPSVPTGLSAVGIVDKVLLDWNDNVEPEADLASYNVYRRESSGSGYLAIANVGSSAYTDTNVVNGTIYYYVVTAVDDTAQESGYSVEAGSPWAKIIVGGATGNGDFNADTSTTDIRVFSDTDHWFNLKGAESVTATRSNLNTPETDNGDGTRNASLFINSAFINSNGYTIGEADEVFQITLDFRDASAWADNTDALEVFFFTSSVPVGAATVEANITQLGSIISFSQITKNNKFEAYSDFTAYTTTADDIGKQVFVGLRVNAPAAHYGRLDNFNFMVVTPLAPTPGAPVTISGIGPVSGGTEMEIKWTGQNGKPYGIETNSNLIFGEWNTFMTGIMGDGGIIVITNTIGPDQTFYRIISE